MTARIAWFVSDWALDFPLFLLQLWGAYDRFRAEKMASTHLGRTRINRNEI